MPSHPVGRRSLLCAGLATVGAGLLATGTGRGRPAGSDFVAPDGSEVRAAEAARKPGTVRDFAIHARTGPVDLGGRTVETWSYGGQVPGPAVRVKAGEVVRVRLTNTLPQPTSIHWHGLALRNDADGVPHTTQSAVAPGGEFRYEFTAAHPGTYWFHPHVGTQLDRGLYAPLIVDDPNEPGGYDDEWVVVLDDWLDGVTGTPDEVLAEVRRGMEAMSRTAALGPSAPAGPQAGGHHPAPSAPSASAQPSTGGHMMMGANSALLGGDAGDVRYPYFLVNGRLATAPATHTGRPGSRVRLRILNAGGDTAFRVAIGGHRMRVTHADGFPVQPIDTDALLVGMGERYDVVVTLGDGVFPLVALAEGKNDAAFAVLRTAGGDPPPRTVRPDELDGRIVGYRQLKPTVLVRLPDRAGARTIKLELTGGMTRYDWGFNGRPFDPEHVEAVRAGERVHLEFVNRTTMWHPVHLHGHTFAIGPDGPRKDTAIVLPGQIVTAVFDADNPGRWMLHCHNVYHAEAGMMTQLGYRQ